MEKKERKSEVWMIVQSVDGSARMTWQNSAGVAVIEQGSSYVEPKLLLTYAPERARELGPDADIPVEISGPDIQTLQFVARVMLEEK